MLRDGRGYLRTAAGFTLGFLGHLAMIALAVGFWFVVAWALAGFPL